MSKYAGTQTEKNLQAAFAGESQARNKYTYFASVAKKEGYEQISAIFLETAENEKEHAKMWFKELEGIGKTTDNLKAAADGENFEWTDMYEGSSPVRGALGRRRDRSQDQERRRSKTAHQSDPQGNGQLTRTDGTGRKTKRDIESQRCFPLFPLSRIANCI